MFTFSLNGRKISAIYLAQLDLKPVTSYDFLLADVTPRGMRGVDV
jgi:hypothetical protein